MSQVRELFFRSALLISAAVIFAVVAPSNVVSVFIGANQAIASAMVGVITAGVGDSTQAASDTVSLFDQATPLIIIFGGIITAMQLRNQLLRTGSAPPFFFDVPFIAVEKDHRSDSDSEDTDGQKDAIELATEDYVSGDISEVVFERRVERELVRQSDDLEVSKKSSEQRVWEEEAKSKRQRSSCKSGESKSRTVKKPDIGGIPRQDDNEGRDR